MRWTFNETKNSIKMQWNYSIEPLTQKIFNTVPSASRGGPVISTSDCYADADPPGCRPPLDADPRPPPMDRRNILTLVKILPCPKFRLQAVEITWVYPLTCSSTTWKIASPKAHVVNICCLLEMLRSSEGWKFKRHWDLFGNVLAVSVCFKI